MKEIKPSYAGIIPSLLWSWILIFIPTIITAIKIAGTKYVISDTQLILSTGLINSKQESIDLYRIKVVTSNQTAFGYGNINIVDQDSMTYVLRYITDANDIANFIKEKSQNARKDQNISVIEKF
ncbi:PH domain-containing protein [Listeria monocytogenes]|uniref:PH domain-containing protein n=1 Tax=Listeria monocytogenes TaxID=1639 RepID=UPI0010DF9DA4|nr:PH domain-containing protein [Listeria monocytogenes]EAC8464699.1 PH domain-containing protein [Listeria monocytogenes]